MMKTFLDKLTQTSQVKSGATICFSKGGKYFKQTGSANLRNF